jgi:hypothetical protein
MRARSLVVPILAIVLAACGAGSSPGPSGSPGPSSSPGPGGEATPSELRIALLTALGPLWYCDPDVYPVARGEEIDLAIRQLPSIVADREAWPAIAAALGLDPADSEPPHEARLAAYRLWKQMQAIELTSTTDGFAFDELWGPRDPAGEHGERIAGLIRSAVDLETVVREPAAAPNCPICLARGTGIATPDGPVPVEAIRVGTVVWTLDVSGARVRGRVLAVASAPVAPTHRVVRLVLADGRSVTASPGHPTADGRSLGSLRPGDTVDGSPVVAADLVPYDGGRTFDLAVSGPTGLYLAGESIPLASTIRRQAIREPDRGRDEAVRAGRTSRPSG